MTAPVYLIASPTLRCRPRWLRWRAELAGLFPGEQLLCWDELPRGFAGIPAPERPGRLARVLSAAVVIPEKHGPRIQPRRLGLMAAAEAEAFAAAGKPVHVYAAGMLTPWPACQVRPAPGRSRHVPLEILIPPPGPDHLTRAARAERVTA